MSNGRRRAYRVLVMMGSHVQMDQIGRGWEPVNPLPVKCRHCTMPNLDFVAKPYLLAKVWTSPAELAPANVGNFFVRERARQILDLVAPGACAFHPTYDGKTRKATDWLLAVPKRLIDVPGLTQRWRKRAHCPKCKEPKEGVSWLSGDPHAGLKRGDWGGIDVAKMLQWDSAGTREDDVALENRLRKEEGKRALDWSHYGLTPPPHRQRWTRVGVTRDVLFSMRLEQLMKQARVRGLSRAHDYDLEATPDDQEWVRAKLDELARAGLLEATRKPTTRRRSRKPLGKKPRTIGAIEQEQRIKLPRDYKEFIKAQRPRMFENVTGQRGFTVEVLPPHELDFRNFRRGRMKDLLGDEESLAVDGVEFGWTEHGDSFVFDVARKDARGNYPVYWYDHEGNEMKPFARTFAGCILRFARRR